MLKGLEALKNVHELIVLECGSYYENNYEEIKIIEKELKALEIIKTKKVDVFWFLECSSLELYNEYKTIKLTQEEYDLLKEVLK